MPNKWCDALLVSVRETLQYMITGGESACWIQWVKCFERFFREGFGCQEGRYYLIPSMVSTVEEDVLT